MAELGPPGVKSTRAWVGHDQRDTRDPPGPRAGHGEARSVGCDCGGGFVRRRSPEFTINGTPGVISTGSWVKDAQHACVIDLGLQRGLARLGAARAATAAALCSEALRRATFRGSPCWRVDAKCSGRLRRAKVSLHEACAGSSRAAACPTRWRCACAAEETPACGVLTSGLG